MKLALGLLVCLALVNGAFAQQRKIKPVTDDCKHTDSVASGNYSLRFCTPESFALQDYLRIQKDVEVTNEDGRETLSDIYYQFGPHWDLSVKIIRFKDGHPIGLDETKENIIKKWHQDNQVLDVQTNEHNECYGLSSFRGIMRDKDGNKVFVKVILNRNDMLLVKVTTYCKNGVCDADTYGYPLLANFAKGPAAYDPKCGYL
jgi:hypothetical protein